MNPTDSSSGVVCALPTTNEPARSTMNVSVIVPPASIASTLGSRSAISAPAYSRARRGYDPAIHASERREHLRIRHVVAEAWRTLRSRPGVFFLAGLLVFIPLGLVDVLDDYLQEPLSEVDVELTAGQIAGLLAAAFAHATVALLGDVLYTGVVARAVVSVRHGDQESLREIVRSLPYWRLAGADLLLAIGVSVGLLLFIIPGLLVLGWFALIAPAIELEDRRILAGFRRSRELVRGNTLRVLLLVVPLLLLDDVISGNRPVEGRARDPFGLLRRLGSGGRSPTC